MNQPNISITTVPELGEMAVARVAGEVPFQFHMHDLQGKLLDDFLIDFNILPVCWAQGTITEYRTYVPVEKLRKWQQTLSAGIVR